MTPDHVPARLSGGVGEGAALEPPHETIDTASKTTAAGRITQLTLQRAIITSRQSTIRQSAIANRESAIVSGV
jgi:hypothetical protein